MRNGIPTVQLPPTDPARGAGFPLPVLPMSVPGAQDVSPIVRTPENRNAYRSMIVADQGLSFTRPIQWFDVVGSCFAIQTLQYTDFLSTAVNVCANAQWGLYINESMEPIIIDTTRSFFVSAWTNTSLSEDYEGNANWMGPVAWKFRIPVWRIGLQKLRAPSAVRWSALQLLVFTNECDMAFQG